jgi:hypothetical protein
MELLRWQLVLRHGNSMNVVAGVDLTRAQREWEFLLENPNTWLSQAEYFRDPAKINQFMAANCESMDVSDPVLREVSARFVTGFDSLRIDDKLTVCLDTNNYIQDYAEYAHCQLHSDNWFLSFRRVVPRLNAE